MAFDRVGHLLALISYLRANCPVTVERAARDLGLTRVALLRDLDDVLMCGTPPYAPHDYVGVTEEGGVLTIDFAPHFARPVRLTAEEALALRLLLDTLPTGEAALRGEAVQRLARKIEEAVAPGPARRAPAAARRILSGPKRGLTGDPRASLLARAASLSRKVVIEYYTAARDEIATRVAHPVGLFEEGGRAYLAAWCESRRGPRSFRLDRIRRVTPMEEPFDPRPGLTIDDFRLRGAPPRLSPGDEVSLLFHPALERRLRREWPAWAVSTARKEGAAGECEGVRVAFNATETDWLPRWLLRYGRRFRVERPAALAARVAEICRRAAAGGSR
ncbi:MAG: WYL domain-containing protein [Planctomycetes bacterium]|nr:WYL domain-containing protein [Planctomycetota bacterium]